MTRMIDRLEQKGLVRRVPNVEDRRATNLEITTAGQSALSATPGRERDRCQAQFLRGFSEDEVRAARDASSNRMLDNR